jgi:hypothetical protein
MYFDAQTYLDYHEKRNERCAERLGDNVHSTAQMTPGIMTNSIDLIRAVIEVPWSMLTGTLDYSAEKVDDLADMAP